VSSRFVLSHRATRLFICISHPHDAVFDLTGDRVAASLFLPPLQAFQSSHPPTHLHAPQICLAIFPLLSLAPSSLLPLVQEDTAHEYRDRAENAEDEDDAWVAGSEIGAARER